MERQRTTGFEFRALLIALLLILVAYPALHGPSGSPVVARVLLTALFLTGGRVVFATHRLRLPATVLGGLAVLGAWTGYTLPEAGATAAAGFHAAAVAFHALVVAVVLRRVYREPTVSADAVAAALCGYLLVGIVFAHCYCLIATAVPGSFSGLTTGASGTETHVQLTYFSFVTLTTVGYGDITPSSDAARSLALLEAVAGQFYLAVLMADLVGKRVAQALPPGSVPPSEAP